MVKKKYKIKKILKQFIERLEAKGIKASYLILYGSYARGNSTRYSDIDIVVVSSDFNGKNILRRQELLGEAIFPLGEPIEALGYTPQECKHPHPLSFIAEVLTTGRVIYRGRMCKIKERSHNGQNRHNWLW